ncbi:hypothetical protein [Thalassobellus citreus]|uniref:hypothetical protein n=1 Tax=Thalassobellus citreus TaxID=3367752 RepID=UPI0037AA4275
MKKTLLKNVLSFCALVFTVGTLSAQNTITWTGAVDSVFVNPANWSPAGIPDNASDVVIDSTTIKPFYITSVQDAGNSDNYISHLTGSGGVLNISGPILIGGGSGNYFGGNLTLNAGADVNIRNQGRFGQAGNPSVINVYGGLLNTKNQLIVGDGGDCTFNINGADAKVTSTGNGLILGGYAGNGVINLFNGELILNGGVKINEAGAGDGYMVIYYKSDTDRGTLKLPGDQKTLVDGLIAANKIRPRPSQMLGVIVANDTTSVIAYEPKSTGDNIDLITWTGAEDTDFLNPNNWDLGVIPNEFDDVQIETSANAPVLGSSLRSIDSDNNFLQGVISHLYGRSGTALTIAAPLAIYGGSGNYMGGDLTLEDGADVNIRNQARFGGSNDPSLVNINGGILNSKNYLIVGDNGDCEFNVNGGEVTSTGQGIILGGYNGYGAVNLNGGSMKLKGLAIDGRADRAGAGHITIDGGSLIVVGDQRGELEGLIADGKIKAAPGKDIVSSFDFTNTTFTTVDAAGPKEVVYLTKAKTMAAGASTVDNDAIIRMLQADANFNVTVVQDPDANIDLSGYDLVIVQETFGSGDAIFTGSASIRNISVPMIINKTYAWKSGKPGITEADASIVESTSLSVSVNHSPRRADPLFSGIDFSEGNDIQLFADLSTDDIGTAGGGAKGLQVLNDIDIANNNIGGSTGSMHAETADVTTPSAAIVFNELRAGVQLGEDALDVLQVPVIAFSMNYGAIALGDGENISSEALTIWRNAAYHLTGMISPNTLYVNPDYIALGIDDITKSNVSTNVKSYGNRVYVSNVKSATEVNIYSITGALVKSLKTNEDTNFAFKSGLWIATVKTIEGQKSVKFITK